MSSSTIYGLRSALQLRFSQKLHNLYKLTALHDEQAQGKAGRTEDYCYRRDIRVSNPCHRPFKPDSKGNSIGFGAAQAFADAGANVTVISSSQEKVDKAIQRLASSNVKGQIANARDEAGLVNVLLSLAPIDHIVYSSVDKIIRGKLEDLDLNEAKRLFEVKFWGAVIVGKGMEYTLSMGVADIGSRT
jgi:hypothetical protein